MTVIQLRETDHAPQKCRQTDDDCDRAIELWNDMAAECGLPKVRMLTGDRRIRLRRVLNDVGLDGWTEALKAVANSPFLCGGGRRGWRANITFMLRPNVVLRILEGEFDDLAG